MVVELDIDAGRELLRYLRNHKYPFDAAYWLREYGDWRLCMHTKLVEQSGPIHAYSELQRVLRRWDDHRLPFSVITIIYANDPVLVDMRATIVIEALDFGGFRATNAVLRNTYVADAFIYLL
jgi:hypothetical protein